MSLVFAHMTLMRMTLHGWIGNKLKQFQRKDNKICGISLPCELPPKLGDGNFLLGFDFNLCLK